MGSCTAKGDKVRFGILSTAKIGREHVIPEIQAAEGIEVVAIASRDADLARRVADDLGIGRSYGSYEALLADADVDAIYNPLPNHLHAPWTMAAARAGKHVLCEKPFALDASEARSVFAAAEGAGVTVMEAFMYGFHPQWEGVLQLTAEGAIGELRGVQSWFSYFGRDPDNIRNVPEWGGGGLYDIGCYAISTARRLFGSEPVEVTATLHREPESGVDVIASGALHFETGQASFTVSTRAALMQRVQAVGTEGTLIVTLPFNPRRDRPTTVELWRDPWSDPEIMTFGPAAQYGLMARAFADAVERGTEPPVSPAETVANMTVIDQIFAGEKPSG